MKDKAITDQKFTNTRILFSVAFDRVAGAIAYVT